MRFPTLTKLQLIRTFGLLFRSSGKGGRLKLIPTGTFGRIALMLAVLLLINQLVTYIWVTSYIIKPQIQQTMYLITPEIKLVGQQLKHNRSQPSLVSNLDSDLRNSGIRLIDSSAGEPSALAQATFYRSLTKELIKNLNRPTEVRLEESDALYAWVKLPDHEYLWLRIPLASIGSRYPAPLVIFIFAITVLSLIGGWWVARSISRPLKRLEFAAREVGRGDRPGDLKVVGTSELKAVTFAFNQMARDVEKFEEDRTLLLAGISHDLRTPLTRIRLASEFLSTTDQELKDGIIRDTEDMDEIIDQFIGFVRDGRDEHNIQENLNELIRIVTAPLEQGANTESSMNITLELTELPDFSFKPLAMKRLLTNLVENAHRYGGKQLNVISEFDEKSIRIRIQDSGPGIKEGDIEELFLPFKRGDAARGGKGTGLGLAIVQKIALLHEGDIRLFNRPEGGLEACLTLPRVREFN